MALSNPYDDLERRLLNLIEWGFHIYSKDVWAVESMRHP
jgi:hypothetical protein